MEQTQDKYEFQVSWEPFLLRPNMPIEGMLKPPQFQGAPKGHLKDAGQAVGINFTGKCDRFPYSLPCHALLEHTLAESGAAKQNELVEVLFQAYFTDGVYPGGENLVNLAEKVGLSRDVAQSVMSDKARLQAAQDKALGWSEKGVSGVPYFYINGQKAFSGAQDAATFVRMFEIITDKYPSASM